MLLDTPPLDPGLPAAIERTVDVLSTALREEWPGRERRPLAPADGLALLRQSGLLTLPVPAQFGGKGATWRTVLDIVRRLAQCDSVVAERLAGHTMQLATILLLGNSEQQGELLFATAQSNLLWGAAMPGATAAVRAVPAAGGFELSGVPAAHAGVPGADRLVVAGRLEDGSGQLLAAINADRPGVRRPDPRAAAGTAYPVEFRRLFVAHEELLGGILGPVPLRATLRPLLEQLTLIHLFLGVAEGAFDDLVQTSRSERPGSLALNSADSSHAPQMLQRYAELWTDLKAAGALTRAATRAFEDAWAEGSTLAAEERARLALDIGEARLLASRAGSQLVQVVFEVAGSAARPAGARFDRWRQQLRTHSLHDPIDFRRREIGRWVLTGELPRPSLFV